METWKPIPGHEGKYEVSDAGRVRSLDRIVSRKDGRSHRCKGRVLAMEPNTGGYLSLRLGRGFPVMAHQLVALAFIGPAEGRYTCHNNGVKSDNQLSNLRYDSAYGNQADRKGHGTEKHGSVLPQAKLNEAQVAEIKARLRRETHAAIAKDYGVCAGTITQISIGNNWRRVIAKED